MKKIITGKNVYYIGGKFRDRYCLLFDNQIGLEVSASDYNKYKIGDEYSLSEDQKQKIIQNCRLDSLILTGVT